MLLRRPPFHIFAIVGWGCLLLAGWAAANAFGGDDSRLLQPVDKALGVAVVGLAASFGLLLLGSGARLRLAADAVEVRHGVWPLLWVRRHRLRAPVRVELRLRLSTPVLLDSPHAQRIRFVGMARAMRRAGVTGLQGLVLRDADGVEVDLGNCPSRATAERVAAAIAAFYGTPAPQGVDVARSLHAWRVIAEVVGGSAAFAVLLMAVALRGVDYDEELDLRSGARQERRRGFFGGITTTALPAWRSADFTALHGPGGTPRWIRVRRQHVGIFDPHRAPPDGDGSLEPVSDLCGDILDAPDLAPERRRSLLESAARAIERDGWAGYQRARRELDDAVLEAASLTPARRAE